MPNNNQPTTPLLTMAEFNKWAEECKWKKYAREIINTNYISISYLLPGGEAKRCYFQEHTDGKTYFESSVYILESGGGVV